MTLDFASKANIDKLSAAFFEAFGTPFPIATFTSVMAGVGVFRFDLSSLDEAQKAFVRDFVANLKSLD